MITEFFLNTYYSFLCLLPETGLTVESAGPSTKGECGTPCSKSKKMSTIEGPKTKLFLFSVVSLLAGHSGFLLLHNIILSFNFFQILIININVTIRL